MSVVRFADALRAACDLVRRHRPVLGERCTLVRDLHGQIAVCCARSPGPDLDALRPILHDALGGFSPGQERAILTPDDFDVAAVLNDPDALRADDRDPPVVMVERQLIGRDWWRGPTSDSVDVPRLAFYGIKGGVGRSTALAVAAWHLASQARRVLVVDLDLESPGAGPLLLPFSRTPRYGVADWLVESVVGQNDRALLDDMMGSSPLAAEVSGEIYVVPAAGHDLGSYAAKLARAYLTTISASGQEQAFAERIDGMLQELSAYWEPDVILLDSRAGLHETAAAVVSRLGAQALLFAGSGEQTFQAYQALFQELRRAPARVQRLRENLKMVASLVPTGGARDAHLAKVLSRSYQLFVDHVYDEIPPGEVSGFNFDLQDQSAPHFPLVVHWDAEFAGDFSPLASRLFDNHALIKATFGALLDGVDRLLE